MPSTTHVAAAVARGCTGLCPEWYTRPLRLFSESPMPDMVTTDVSPKEPLVAALGQRSIVLIGMMGAGKSSVGRRLAVRLDIPFVDADTQIEEAAQMTIPDI